MTRHRYPRVVTPIGLRPSRSISGWMAVPDWWPAIFLGWPSALAGGALLVAGGLSGKSWLAGLGALSSAGFCLYVSMNPMPLRLAGVSALVCNAAFVLAVRRGAHPTAFLWLVPFFALAAFAAQAAFGAGGAPSNESLERTSGLAATFRSAQVRHLALATLPSREDRMKLKHAVLAVALAGAAAGLALASSEEPAPPAQFLMTLSVSANGAALTCARGCAWKELTFNCGGRTPCVTGLDGFGMTKAR